MPVTRLANSAIDGVARTLAETRAEIARYAGSDLVCYRADEPEALVALQAAAFDPVLAWAREALGARFVVGAGRDASSRSRSAALGGRAAPRSTPIEGPFAVAALHVLTSLSGSALIALAVARGRDRAPRTPGAPPMSTRISRSDNGARTTRRRRAARRAGASSRRRPRRWRWSDVGSNGRGRAMNWGAFDLNLLIVFDAVMQERSVTRAGNRIGLSQPAMSHALNRLRHMLKDELFVRTPEGMAPTARAEMLALPLRKALSEMQLALEPASFDPASSDRRFALALNNYAAVVLAPPLVAATLAAAPAVHLDLRPSGTLDLVDRLDRGDIDLVIGGAAGPGERFATSSLFEDPHVLVMRRGHPLEPPEADRGDARGHPASRNIVEP